MCGRRGHPANDPVSMPTGRSRRLRGRPAAFRGCLRRPLRLPFRIKTRRFLTAGVDRCSVSAEALRRSSSGG